MWTEESVVRAIMGVPEPPPRLTPAEELLRRVAEGLRDGNISCELAEELERATGICIDG